MITTSTIGLCNIMDGSVVVDGEASETESEYSDSEEEFSECVENSTIQDGEISPGSTHDDRKQEALASNSSSMSHNIPAAGPEINDTNSVVSSSSVPRHPPSPSLTLFEENLRERNAVFSNQISGLINGYFDRVLGRIRFLNTDCKALQVNFERVTADCQSSKSNLTRGLNQLDAVLALSLLPER